MYTWPTFSAGFGLSLFFHPVFFVGYFLLWFAYSARVIDKKSTNKRSTRPSFVFFGNFPRLSYSIPFFFFFNIANCAAGTLAGLAKGIQWWFDILLEDVLLTILKESRQSVCTCVLCLEAAMLLYVQNLTFNCSHACQGVYGNEFSSYCRRTDPVTWCLCHRCVSRSTFQVEPGSHAPLRTKLNF